MPIVPQQLPVAKEIAPAKRNVRAGNMAGERLSPNQVSSTSAVRSSIVTAEIAQAITRITTASRVPRTPSS